MKIRVEQTDYEDCYDLYIGAILYIDKINLRVELDHISIEEGYLEFIDFWKQRSKIIDAEFEIDKIVENFLNE